MCGRYFVDINETEIQNIIASAKHNDNDSAQTTLFKGGEIFPTNTVPVITAADTRFMVWGFPDYTGKRPLINARSETASVTRTFKESFAQRRCIVPATSYFEWKTLPDKRAKQKYEFKLTDKSLLYLAGIYSLDGRFAILTRAAVSCLTEIHDRMPVILPFELSDIWLNKSPDIMNNALTELLFAPRA